MAYRVDLNAAVHILRLNSHDQGFKPFEAGQIITQPEEVNLTERSPFISKVLAIPDALQDGSQGSM